MKVIQARRERSDKISQLMGEYLLKGYKMLGIVCDICEVNIAFDKKYTDEVRFVLDKHAELDFYSASSLKQQTAGRHVAPLGHIGIVCDICEVNIAFDKKYT
jgi:predicted HNH restriction endonuclease